MASLALRAELPREIPFWRSYDYGAQSAKAIDPLHQSTYTEFLREVVFRDGVRCYDHARSGEWNERRNQDGCRPVGEVFLRARCLFRRRPQLSGPDVWLQ